MKFKLVAACILCLCVITAKAQYVIENPTYTKIKTNLSVKRVQFYPDSIAIDYSYKRINKDYEIFYKSSGHLDFPDGYKAEIFKMLGIKADKQQSDKNHDFTIVYNFSFYKDFLKQMGSYTFSNSVRQIYPTTKYEVQKTFNVHECDDEGCFNVTAIPISLNTADIVTLYSASILKEWKKKDEFETTRQYQARTSEDSLTLRLKDPVEMLVRKIGYYYIRQSSTPSIEYNADAGEFVIKYSYFDAVRIAVPSSKAKAFKEAFTAGTISADEGTFYINKDNKVEIRTMIFKDSKTRESFSINTADRIQKSSFDTYYSALIGRIKKHYPKLL